MRLSGWVHRKCDHGQLLFIDLRDHFGITQIMFQPEHAFFAQAEGPDGFTWMTNDSFLTKAVFGTLEVNFNWYSGWAGRDRVVILTMPKAKETGAPVVR